MNIRRAMEFNKVPIPIKTKTFDKNVMSVIGRNFRKIAMFNEPLVAVRCYSILSFLSYCINSTGAPLSSIKATIKPSEGELGSIIIF